MNIGPDLYYKCPKCGKTSFRGSLLSGNTFGGKFFSDGKLIAPMLPEFPAIIRCKNCKDFYWLSDENQIDGSEILGADDDW
jgi:predicted nucleic-acid-binding Zn-ribbon protein